MDEYVIQTEKLTKDYSNWLRKTPRPALDQLTISIPKGCVFGFLGPNGAGKTTTIKILMGLIRPTGGTASVLGKPYDDVESKNRIGFLPDSPAFTPTLSANEFLDVCARLLRIPSDRRKKRVEEVLEIVRMSQHAKSKIGTFSRGMLQRIGIAQAILNNPDLLILDEPLLGLDPYGRQEFKEIILKKIEEAKKNLELLNAAVANEGNDVTDTSPTFKTLEDGNAVLSKEENSKLAARQQKFIKDLEAALIRIENKTYGICKVTGKLIPKERLRIVPHTTMTIEAKEMLSKRR